MDVVVDRPELKKKLEENQIQRMPEFVAAAMRGDLAQVRTFLADPSLDVNQQDEESQTALHWAASYNEPAIIGLLLSDSRVDPNVRNKRGGTPLHAATLNGSHEALRALLKDPRVDKNAVNQWSESALILAATCGDVAAGRILLIEGGVDATIKDRWGKTAVQVAIDHGERNFESIFASNLQPITSSQKTNPPSSSLAQAVTKTTPSQSKKILSKMMEAPLNEELALGWISDPNVDVVGFDFYKWTALHKCAAWDKPRVLEALVRHSQVATTAIAGQAGDHPLHVAADVGSLRCLELLVSDPRTQINAQNDHGATALMIAASNGHSNCVELLLHRGASPNVVRKSDGKYAYHLALEANQKEIAQILLSKLPEEKRVEALRLADDFQKQLQAKEESERAKAKPVARKKLDGGLLAAHKKLFAPLPPKPPANPHQ